MSLCGAVLDLLQSVWSVDQACEAIREARYKRESCGGSCEMTAFSLHQGAFVLYMTIHQHISVNQRSKAEGWKGDGCLC